jgi:hypothetical protein
MGKGGLALGTMRLIAVSGLTHAPDTRFDFEFAKRGTAETPGLEVPPAHSARLRQT